MEPSSHSVLQLRALYLDPCTEGTRETISGSARDKHNTIQPEHGGLICHPSIQEAKAGGLQAPG